MPDDPRRDPDDLDLALFATTPSRPPRRDDDDLDSALFGGDTSGDLLDSFFLHPFSLFPFNIRLVFG